MSVAEALGLILIAAAASVFGSLVGLGGGFIMTPVLRVAFALAPAVASGTSLVMVLANSAGSTYGYLRHRRVDVPLATWLAVGSIPGSVAGVFIVHRLNAIQFDVIYGVILIALAIATAIRRGIASRPEGERTFLHEPPIAIAGGLVLGIGSSVFGIGGGIVVVPLMLIAARMPAHIVTATSTFVIVLTAPVGIIVHALQDDVDWQRGAALAVGGLAGGLIAPPIAKRISSPQLVNLLIAAFIIAAIGLIARHLR